MSKNNNCLEGKACPKCGSLEPFYITAQTLVTVFDDGTGDTQDFEWDDNSYCSCQACGFSGVLKDFQIPETEAA
jgi:hypothetical protein